MIIIMFVTIFLLVLLLSWIQFYIDAKKLNVPGPVALPIVGNGHLFLGDPTCLLKAFAALKRKYGPAVRVYILSTRFVLLFHPKYIESIVSRSDTITKGFSYNFLHPWLGQGLLTATGERWKLHRKFLTPAFHFVILQTFLPVFIKNEKILIKNLEKVADGRSIDLFPLIALTALDNITETIMGVSVQAQENCESKYVRAIENVSGIMTNRMRNLFLSKDFIFNLTQYKQIQDAGLKVLNGQTLQVIENRRRELESNNVTTLEYNSEYGMKNRHAFLDLLLLSEVNGEKIDNEKVKEEVNTFMFEGHDTTTCGIVFTLYCISQYQQVQEKILQEQISIFGDNMERSPTYKELNSMKYLELVIKESLRLYPPVPLIQRLMTQDIDVAGLNIIKGTTIMIDIFNMQRCPDIFEAPLEFRPERFENNMKSSFDWLAFSAGPRNCIGQKFAMMEMKVVIAEIVKRFQLLPANKEPNLQAELILRSQNGVHVKLLPRH